MSFSLQGQLTTDKNNRMLGHMQIILFPAWTGIIYLFIHLLIYLFIYLYIYLFIQLFIYSFIYLPLVKSHYGSMSHILYCYSEFHTYNKCKQSSGC